MANKHYHIGQEICKNVNIGTSLINKDYKIVKLGITTMPGVKFIINETQEDTGEESVNPPIVEIGRTGFLELDLKNLGMYISKIQVADDEGSSRDKINNNYCYIDYIYYKDE